MIEIIRRWLGDDKKLMVGQSKGGQCFYRHKDCKANLVLQGLDIRNGIVYNKFACPVCKKVIIVRRHG